MPQSAEEWIERAYSLRGAGDVASAEQAYSCAAELARAAGDSTSLAHALRHLSDLSRERGAAAEALTSAREALILYRSDPDSRPLDLANALRLQALALEGLSRREEALPCWREALGLYRQANVAPAIAECERRLRP